MALPSDIMILYILHRVHAMENRTIRYHAHHMWKVHYTVWRCKQ